MVAAAMQKLVDGVHAFQAQYFARHRDLFQKLAERGQRPEALFITCSDSRVVPNLITSTEPGDLFLVRNVGNIVPHISLPGGTAAAIEYAVEVLGITDVIVCGHTPCGAIQALLDPASMDKLPFVKRWLAQNERVRDIVTERYAHLDDAGRLTAAVEENVLVSLENLRAFPFVAERLAKGTLTMSGWVYKIESRPGLRLRPPRRPVHGRLRPVRPAPAHAVAGLISLSIPHSAFHIPYSTFVFSPPGTLVPATPRLTLARLFVVTTLALALAGGGAFAAFMRSAQADIVARSAERREATASRVEERVSAALGAATTALDELEHAMRLGVLAGNDPDAVEARLFGELLDHPTLSDVTLTHPENGAFAWQVSVFRTSEDPASEVWTRRVRREGGALVAEVRRRPRGAGLLGAPFAREPGKPDDPTAHATYAVTVSPQSYGRRIASDLSYSELDAMLPATERRVVLTFQKAIEDAPGHLAGVLRVGLLARTIDSIPALGANDVDPGGPERVFLCDAQGRLLARLAPDDRIAVFGEDLRIVPARTPPEIAAALSGPQESGTFDAAGEHWLVTFRALPGTQDWRVGIVAPGGVLHARSPRAARPLPARARGAHAPRARRRRRRAPPRAPIARARRRRHRAHAPLRPRPRAGRRAAARRRGGHGGRRAREDGDARARQVRADGPRAPALRGEPRAASWAASSWTLSLMFTDIEGFTTPLRAPRAGRARRAPSGATSRR